MHRMSTNIIQGGLNELNNNIQKDSARELTKNIPRITADLCVST